MIRPDLTAKYALQGVWFLVIAIVVAGSLVFGISQYLRVEGYKFLFLEAEGYKPAYQRVKADNKTLIKAAKDAQGMQQAVNAAAERDYADLSERIDDEYKPEIANQLDRAERFIRANRVRNSAACQHPASTASAAAGDNSARSGDAARAAALLDGASGDYVLVTPDDVRICTVNTLQAEASRTWALTLEARSAAPSN